MMSDVTGQYVPSPEERTRNQVELYERTGGKEGNLWKNAPVIIVTTVGKKSGAVRKFPLMKVEYQGEYALVASMGGAPKSPVWYGNIVENPTVTIQDGDTPKKYSVVELSGELRSVWWDRAVAAYADYADYQTLTERVIPVLLASELP